MGLLNDMGYIKGKIALPNQLQEFRNGPLGKLEGPRSQENLTLDLRVKTLGLFGIAEPRCSTNFSRDGKLILFTKNKIKKGKDR